MLRRFLSIALLALPLAVACSVSEATSNPLSAGPPNTGDDPALGGVQTSPPPGDKATDAGASGELCGMGECTPDDDGRVPLGDKKACAPPVPDGGVSHQDKEADASTKVTACRVTANKEGPRCGSGTESAANADLRGTDGVTCQADTDCAPGFDCVALVAGEKNNVCRRYCCSGSCEGVTSQNGGPTFCDVRRVVRNEAATNELLAPICAPIKTCTLLKEDDCAVGETCAIVNDSGATGCVPVDGSAADVGEPCDKKHCKAKQTCLGSPGDRKCYQLCKTTDSSSSACGDDEVCTTSSAFLDTAYGVCKRAK